MSDTRPEIEFLSQLYGALADDAPTIGDLRKSLRERGLDADRTVGAVRQLVADHTARQRRQQARERLERVRAALEQWKARGCWPISRVRDDLARALAGEGGGLVYQAYHRKLDQVSEDDLESLGEDAAVLELIERIENDATE